MNSMKLSLAPVSYFWSKADTQAFYVDIINSPVDIVYLGEVVCSRRNLMKFDDWFELAKELKKAGKSVVISTQTLIDNESDRRSMRRLIERAIEADITVEANDFSAVRALHQQGQRFVAGPHLNVYHTDTMNWLASLGATRFTLPFEMSGIDLQALQASRAEGLETEVHVWGRLALAFSARCFTARHHRLKKDECEFRCENYPDGLSLSTRERRIFLNLNGIQTQSASCLDLGTQIPDLAAMKIDVLRLQPQSQHTASIIEHFDAARHQLQAAIVPDELLPIAAARSNGYWFGSAGMQWQQAS